MATSAPFFYTRLPTLAHMHMMGAAAGARSVASGHVSPVPFCRSGSHVLFLACHASTGAEAGNSSEQEQSSPTKKEAIFDALDTLTNNTLRERGRKPYTLQSDKLRNADISIAARHSYRRYTSVRKYMWTLSSQQLRDTRQQIAVEHISNVTPFQVILWFDKLERSFQDKNLDKGIKTNLKLVLGG